MDHGVGSLDQVTNDGSVGHVADPGCGRTRLNVEP
jgi:hypothetical protein